MLAVRSFPRKISKPANHTEKNFIWITSYLPSDNLVKVWLTVTSQDRRRNRGLDVK